jgi:hypothetical protein
MRNSRRFIVLAPEQALRSVPAAPNADIYNSISAGVARNRCGMPSLEPR